MTLNNDETFLKEFLKEWTKDFFNINEKKFEKILKLIKLMENHNKDKDNNWFTSLIGFFYEYGIGETIIIDKNKSLKLYLLSINNYYKNKFLCINY
ncbi:hypothetical protein RhiirC2_802055 [Rhizophagus irregularis]|uniref:Uncharacterized protein n=1 Tax=Rhizophagus irregularis TaxID=588596 RepID=A0A2N1M1Q1_9GLOM|nr:hypothetical protein RhiirC2_802055 [Rhizophagus irregularis]